MGNTPNDPGYRTHYNINASLKANNQLDDNENPTGGDVYLQVTKNGDTEFPALVVNWQDSPRGTGETNADGSPVLAQPNGAFVEDVLWAALQRLEFFNESKYRDRANSLAITKIEEALQALKNRQLERSHRNVEGKHEV
jgi:hypothetical protein